MAAIAVVVLAGCGTQRQSRGTSAWVDSLPPTRRGVLFVQGLPKSTAFVLERSHDSLVVFYRPADVVYESRAFGGSWSDIDLFFRPPQAPATAGMDSIQPRGFGIHIASIHLDRSREEASHNDGRDPPGGVATARSARLYPWTVEEFEIRGDRGGGVHGRYVGQMLVGLHGGRWFWIVEHYPPEMADGIRSRLQAVRDSWIWTDTRTALAAEH